MNWAHCRLEGVPTSTLRAMLRAINRRGLRRLLARQIVAIESELLARELAVIHMLADDSGPFRGLGAS